jgi:hypothetical protein
VKQTTGLITRLVSSISTPLNDALRASEALLAPQMDAGCKGHAAKPPKATAGRPD